MNPETATDQVLSDIGLREVIAGIRVIQELVFRKDAPLRIEVVINTSSHLKGEATVIPVRIKAPSHVANG